MWSGSIGAEFSALDGQDVAPFAAQTGTVVALSGATDVVADGLRCAAILNGDPLMARVTAMGCAASRDRRRVPCGRGRRIHRRLCRAIDPRHRRRGCWRAGQGARQLCGRHPRRASRPRCCDVDRSCTSIVMVDLRLYALLDPAQRGGRDLSELARLIGGAATLVQLRDNRRDARDDRAGEGNQGGASPCAAADQRSGRCCACSRG